MKHLYKGKNIKKQKLKTPRTISKVASDSQSYQSNINECREAREGNAKGGASSFQTSEVGRVA
jgi:hypothetical protein